MMVSSTSPSPWPPISPPQPPFSTTSPCFLIPKCLNQLHFTTFALYFPPIVFLIVSFFSSLCSSPYFRDNSLTNVCGLLPAHFFLWARHPLQVALSPLNISNTLCPLHFQHCFSTSSTTISPHAIPCFLVVKCPPHPLFWILHSHTSKSLIYTISIY